MADEPTHKHGGLSACKSEAGSIVQADFVAFVLLEELAYNNNLAATVLF